MYISQVQHCDLSGRVNYAGVAPSAGEYFWLKNKDCTTTTTIDIAGISGALWIFLGFAVFIAGYWIARDWFKTHVQ